MVHAETYAAIVQVMLRAHCCCIQEPKLEDGATVMENIEVSAHILFRCYQALNVPVLNDLVLLNQGS